MLARIRPGDEAQPCGARELRIELPLSLVLGNADTAPDPSEYPAVGNAGGFKPGP